MILPHSAKQGSRFGRRAGISLMETVVTVSLSALLMAPLVDVLRVSRDCWEAVDSDQTRLEAAHQTLRQVARHVRPSQGVAAINTASPAGRLSILGADNVVRSWRLDRQGQVWFAAGSSEELVADGVSQLVFVGFAADGLTPTRQAGEIRSIDCVVGVVMDRTPATRLVRRRIWIRG